jgi:hypothetical protein
VSVLTYYMGLAGLSSDLGWVLLFSSSDTDDNLLRRGPHGQVIVKRLTPEIGNLHSVVNLALDSPEEATIQPLLRGAIAAAINLSKFIRYTHLGNPETVRLAGIAAGKLGDPVLRADVLYHLAWISLTTPTSGQDSDPEHLCREALALYEENENVPGRAGSRIATLHYFYGFNLLCPRRMHLVTGTDIQSYQTRERVQRII